MATKYRRSVMLEDPEWAWAGKGGRSASETIRDLINAARRAEREERKAAKR